MIPALPSETREVFASFTGAAFPVGTYKNKEHAKADFKQDFLKSTSFTPENQLEPIKNGLSETKFNKGFYRRHESQIKNILAEEERRDTNSFQSKKAEISQQINEKRTDFLRNVNNYNGYDVITGQLRPETLSTSQGRGSRPPTSFAQSSSKPNAYPHFNQHQQVLRPSTTGIKIHPNQGLGTEAPHRGQQVLRDSDARFFAPIASGHRQDYRQRVLYREGLPTDHKYCGILDYTKKDIISYGVEDQFSKAEYLLPKQQPSQDTRYGLFEKRLPGKFTPRNIPNHPSANPQNVKNWTTKVDLFNKTTKDYKPTKK
jgi:hypothetical protein